MEDLLSVSHLHTEGVTKYKTYLVPWLNSLNQEIVMEKVVKKKVQINDAKAHKIYFILRIAYSVVHFFFNFPTSSISIYFILLLLSFPVSIILTLVTFPDLCQKFFHYPFPLDSPGSSGQWSPLLNSARLGYSQKGLYRRNYLKAWKNFNKWYLVILIFDNCHLRMFVEIRMIAFVVGFCCLFFVGLFVLFLPSSSPWKSLSKEF